MSAPLISVKGLGKKFSRNEQITRQQIRRHVLQAMFGRLSPPPKTALEENQFWALHDINFDVKRGQALGIIGYNGAGKTTLLNILAGFSKPDIGEVNMKGRIVSLINLTNGMQDNLTGRENIYTKGALNGLSETEIQGRAQQIIDFAELEYCIDAPYKTYSSGMKMRLAFAINIHSDADIFLVDEVLSVGDFMFRNKCLAKINSLYSNVAFILVSHSMGDIIGFCASVMMLSKGSQAFLGDAREGASLYLEPDREPNQQEDSTPTSFVFKKFVPELLNSSEKCEIVKITVNDKPQSKEQITLNPRTPFKLEILLNLPKRLSRVTVRIAFVTPDNDLAAAETSDFDFHLKDLSAGHHTVRINAPSLCLYAGVFSCYCIIRSSKEILLRKPLFEFNYQEKASQDLYHTAIRQMFEWTFLHRKE